MHRLHEAAGLEDSAGPGAPAQVGLEEVSTSLPIRATSDRVWRALLFYEQLESAPPLLLRLLLPVPLGTTGTKEAVGDEARCLYRSGHLVKRVTGIEEGRRYQFAVVEQRLAIGGGVRLHGGSYALSPRGDGGTDLRALTRYTTARAPRWLWRRIEAAVCHAFHRHLLRAIARSAERA